MESLIPKPVTNVSIKSFGNVSNSSLAAFRLFFTLPSDMENISHDLVFELRLKAKDESESEWQSILFENVHNRNEVDAKIKYLIINDLNYANTIYQFKLRAKSKFAPNEEEMWSKFVHATFKTPAKLPEKAPKICSSCFNIMDNGKIFFYWMDINKFDQNGDNFTYFFEIFNERHQKLMECYEKKTFYEINANEHNNTKKFVIHLYSFNHMGMSKKYSTISIPTMQNLNFIHIKKELIDEIGYKLSWRLKEGFHENIESFTIIWCRQRNELPNKCDNPIHFHQLPPQKREFVLNTSFSHQLGVAANYYGKNPMAFQWAKCTASKPNGIEISLHCFNFFVT
jgi:hypothetical protein